MKPRLFWTMLLAFTLVIVSGICGMVGFFVVSAAAFRDWGPSRDDGQRAERAYAEALADYYIAHGGSWEGLDRRVDDLLGGAFFFKFAVVDNDGRIVASADPALQPGQQVNTNQIARGEPIEARGERVGTLIRHMGPGGPFSPPRDSAIPDMFSRVLRGFVLAGLGLATVLLLLAVVFSGWFSRPLRAITQAAQELAAGRLDVQVKPATVREMDDLARAFNTMAQALAAADRQRRQLTADVAHELRTPLSIIKGRLEGVQDGVYEATPEQIEGLLRETALLERLIDDLRVLALAEAGQLPLYPELIDPRDLIESAQRTFAEQAATQQVTLHADIPEEIPSIDADPQRMAQALGNLVANALRYTPAGGAITLSVQGYTNGRQKSAHAPAAIQSTIDTFPTAIIFRVCDTGKGIAPEHLPHIFDRFWRTDRSRARGSGGAGLGLAIVRQIAVAHGGVVWAESVEGQGTTVSMALPAADAALV
jgi:two-component system OmpR family sensor kinase/two-component system sensor histidine kinase BaeS